MADTTGQHRAPLNNIAPHGQTVQHLVPDPDNDDPLFWAKHAVNSATTSLAFSSFLDTEPFLVRDQATYRGLFTAESLLKTVADKDFAMARESGQLLFAWHGSAALLQGGAA